MKDFRLQDTTGKQNFHEIVKKVKVFEPVIDSNKSTFEGLTKTIILTSKENNKALENLSNKRLETENDRAILASWLMSLLSKITNSENTNQFNLLKDSSSNRVNDWLINKRISITLYDNLLTFRDTNKQFEMKDDFLRRITKAEYSVDLGNLSNKKYCMKFQRKCISMKELHSIKVTEIDLL